MYPADEDATSQDGTSSNSTKTTADAGFALTAATRTRCCCLGHSTSSEKKEKTETFLGQALDQSKTTVLEL